MTTLFFSFFFVLLINNSKLCSTKRKNERIDQLIAEYLSGSLTADDFQELKNWSQQVGREPYVCRNQIEVWFSSGVTAKDKVFNKEEAFARFQKRIGKKEPKVYRFSWKTFYRVAAVILIVLLPAGRLLERDRKHFVRRSRIWWWKLRWSTYQTVFARMVRWYG